MSYALWIHIFQDVKMWLRLTASGHITGKLSSFWEGMVYRDHSDRTTPDVSFNVISATSAVPRGYQIRGKQFNVDWQRRSLGAQRASSRME